VPIGCRALSFDQMVSSRTIEFVRRAAAAVEGMHDGVAG
jgi:hypothetical protein